MRSICVLAALILLAPVAVRAQDSRRDQVAAANTRAIANLRDKIAAEPIGRNITVSDLLDRTNSKDTFTKTLSRAQQIGGPRWIDAQTCQVRLDISGQRAAAALLSIVASDPKHSPIALDVLTARLRDWQDRTFSATGTSTGASAAEQLRPMDQGSPWAQVDDRACRQLIAAARKSAADDVVRAIQPIALSPANMTVGDEMKNADVRSAVESWLASRPVTQVEFGDDLSVRVTIATPSSELFNAFASTARKQPELSKLSQADWEHIRSGFAARVSDSSHGSARAGMAQAASHPAIRLTALPDWIDQQLDGEASAPAHGSKLKTARVAEHAADEQVRAKVIGLPLGQSMTIGQAARNDPQIAQALDRAIDRARPTRVDYRADGSVKVRVTLDLSDLWQEIQDLVR